LDIKDGNEKEATRKNKSGGGELGEGFGCSGIEVEGVGHPSSSKKIQVRKGGGEVRGGGGKPKRFKLVFTRGVGPTLQPTINHEREGKKKGPVGQMRTTSG